MLSNLNTKMLSCQQIDMMNRIEAANMDFVFYKLLAERKIEAYDAKVLEEEFKKFIFLSGLNIYPLAMISPLVDEVWHQFILFTKQYREFCFNTVGHFIGHLPDTPMTPVPLAAGENFRSGYKKYFGALPEIWYKDMDIDTKSYYLQEELIGKPIRMWSGWAGPE